MSKAPSPAQLAARAKFAAAARSGKFKRTAAKAKPRKRNPVPAKTGDGPEYFARVKGRGWVVAYQRNAPVHVWQYSKSFADATILGEGQAVQVKTMCDHCSAPCELVSVKDNPLTRVRVKSPSMATGAPPSKRLTKRRKATAKAAPGYYANPVKFQHSVHAADRMDNVVQARHGRAWSDVARFVDFNTAKQYAQAYADAHNVQVKVLGNFGDKYAKARA